MTAVKKEIIVLSAVALGSMAIGFLVVLLVLGPGEDTTLPDPFAGSSAAGADPATGLNDDTQGKPPEHDPQPTGAPVTGDPKPSETVVSQPHESAPPPKVAGTISLKVGDPFIWRCWPEGSDTHQEKEACGTLSGVDSIVEDRLGVIEQCVVDHAGKNASGKLSLALRVDFSDGSVKAWLGNSTTVEKMADVSACLRTGFAEASPPAVDHDHARYIVFFNVEVG